MDGAHGAQFAILAGHAGQRAIVRWLAGSGDASMCPAALAKAQARALRRVDNEIGPRTAAVQESQAMDIATQNHLKVLRELLEYRLRDLRSEIGHEESARREVALDEGFDTKDRAEREQSSAVADSEEQRDWNEATSIERALRRLDRGDYGDCLDCGEPIPIQRLLVQPAAELCVSCQHAHESSRGAARTA
jgi:DnaK suppressor protein